MKITEILVESQQLDEGPILNKIGSAVGKAAGTVAKGVGAVAGGIAGVGSAIKKGWDAGKSTVAGAGDDETDPNTPATPATTKPAAKSGAPAATAPGGGVGTQPAATDVNAAGPKGTAPAQNLKGAAKIAADKTAAATQDQNATQAGQTVYAQVKANIDKLDKKGKQRILQLLQKSVTAPAAPAAPAADPGAGAMGNMAGQLAKGGAAEPNTMANAPVSKTNIAKPGNPNAAPAAPKGNYDGDTGEPISDKGKADAASMAAYKASPKGQAQQAKWDAEDAAAAGKTAKKTKTASRVPKKAAPDQATIDAERERIMGPTSDSIIRTRPMMAESFSLFRKR
jgi:hypothetical protein